MHGKIGVHGVIMLGVFASEFPTLQGPAGEAPVISLSGQVVGAVVFAWLHPGLCVFVYYQADGYVMNA